MLAGAVVPDPAGSGLTSQVKTSSRLGIQRPGLGATERRFVQAHFLEHRFDQSDVNRVTPMGRRRHRQFERLEPGPRILGDERLKRLGRRSQIEGSVDVTGVSEQGSVAG